MLWLAQRHGQDWRDDEVLVVVYTHRDGDIRIMSSWRAPRRDRESYAKASQARQV